jgi:hypothetical protein
VGQIIIVTRHADDYCCANCIRFLDRKRIAVSHRNNCVFAPTGKATKDSPAKDVGSLAKVRITSIHVGFATLKMLISLEGAHVFNVSTFGCIEHLRRALNVVVSALFQVRSARGSAAKSGACWPRAALA